MNIRIAVLAAVSILFLSCGNRGAEQVRSMEETYAEEGIPVVLRSVGEQDFSTYLTFTAPVKGITESTGSAMVSDTVESVLVEVGDFVEKDQPLIRFPKDNPAVGYYQAKAAFETASQAFLRVESLYNRNGVSRSDYDQARMQFEVQQANWRNVSDMVEVKAPISGYVTRLGVMPSDNVQPGTTLFTVSNYDELTAVLQVADHEISRIRVGQPVLGVWEDQVLWGEVTQVDLSKNSMTKAFAVHIRLDNGNHSVPSGVTATVHIETDLAPSAQVVHRREMVNIGEDWFVYVEEDGNAVLRKVETGRRQGLYFEITGGLDADDKIVSEGVSLVRDGSLLQITSESSNEDFLDNLTALFRKAKEGA